MCLISVTISLRVSGEIESPLSLSLCHWRWLSVPVLRSPWEWWVLKKKKKKLWSKNRQNVKALPFSEDDCFFTPTVSQCKCLGSGGESKPQNTSHWDVCHLGCFKDLVRQGWKNTKCAFLQQNIHLSQCQKRRDISHTMNKNICKVWRVILNIDFMSLIQWPHPSNCVDFANFTPTVLGNFGNEIDVIHS